MQHFFYPPFLQALSTFEAKSPVGTTKVGETIERIKWGKTAHHLAAEKIRGLWISASLPHH